MAGSAAPKSDAEITASEYDARYRRALEHLRRERPEEIRAAYLEADSRAAALRFGESEEFGATVRLLRSCGMPDKAAILDLGAGNGMAALAFAALGARVTAVEPCAGSDYGAEAIRRLSDDLQLPVQVVSAWGESLPLADGSFDVVYVRQSLHHARDLRQMLREAGRVLRTGGLFLALREHVVSDAVQLREFQLRHPMHQLGVPEHAYPVREYLAAIREASLQVKRVLRPHDYPIQLDPPSLRLALAALQPRARAWLGERGAVLFARAAGRALASWPAGAILNLVRRPPGRLYGFLARKRVPL